MNKSLHMNPDQLSNYECRFLDCIVDLATISNDFEAKIELMQHLLSVLTTRTPDQTDYATQYYDQNSMVTMLDVSDIPIMSDEERKIFYMSAMRQMQAFMAVSKTMKTLKPIESYESARREYIDTQIKTEEEPF